MRQQAINDCYAGLRAFLPIMDTIGRLYTLGVTLDEAKIAATAYGDKF